MMISTFLHSLYLLIGQNVIGGFLNYQHDAILELKIRKLLVVRILRTVNNQSCLHRTCSFSAGVFVADLERWEQQEITAHLDHWLSLNAKCVEMTSRATC